MLTVILRVIFPFLVNFVFKTLSTLLCCWLLGALNAPSLVQPPTVFEPMTCHTGANSMPREPFKTVQVLLASLVSLKIFL